VIESCSATEWILELVHRHRRCDDGWRKLGSCRALVRPVLFSVCPPYDKDLPRSLAIDQHVLGHGFAFFTVIYIATIYCIVSRLIGIPRSTNNSDRHTKHYHCDHIGTFILNLLDSTTLLLYHQYDPLRILLPRRFCLRDFGKSRNQRWRCVLYCTSSSIFIVRSARFQVYTWWWRWWWWWEHVLYDCA